MREGRIPSFIEQALNKKMLPRPQIEALLVRAQAGDIRSRDVVIENYMRLVLQMAKRFGVSTSVEDAMQEGALGLMDAIRLWSPKEGANFTTYAYFWIRAKMTKAHQHSTGMIFTKSRQDTKRRPVTPEKFISIEGTESGDPGYSTITSAMVDQGPSPEDLAMERQRKSKIDATARWACQSERDRDILRRLKGNDETLAQIGKRQRLSRERVRQLEARLKGRLRKLLSKQEVA